MLSRSESALTGHHPPFRMAHQDHCQNFTPAMDGTEPQLPISRRTMIDCNEDKTRTTSSSTSTHCRSSVAKRPNQPSLRKRRNSAKPSQEEIEACFGIPLAEAAVKLDICSTKLKRLCREYNIQQWPFRQVRSMKRCLEMEDVNVEVMQQANNSNNNNNNNSGPRISYFNRNFFKRRRFSSTSSSSSNSPNGTTTTSMAPTTARHHHASSPHRQQPYLREEDSTSFSSSASCGSASPDRPTRTASFAHPTGYSLYAPPPPPSQQLTYSPTYHHDTPIYTMHYQEGLLPSLRSLQLLEIEDPSLLAKCRHHNKHTNNPNLKKLDVFSMIARPSTQVHIDCRTNASIFTTSPACGLQHDFLPAAMIPPLYYN